MAGTEEDTELRDLVTQALENNGLLGKIQAQLRAGVFLALEEHDKKNRKNHHNKRLQSFMATKEGQTVIGLLHEFLEFFQLDYTSAVFEPESGTGGKYEGRISLENKLKIKGSEDQPLIATLLKQLSTTKDDDKDNSRKTVSSNPSTIEDNFNDSMDFFNKREPIENLVNKYANKPGDIFSPPAHYKEGDKLSPRLSENPKTSEKKPESPKSPPASASPSEATSDQISEHITESIETESFQPRDQVKQGCEGVLADKIDNLGISTPVDMKYEDDEFEKNVTERTDEVSGISDIDDLLQTTDKVTTDKAGEESMLTSDHTISVGSVGDADYMEDMTF